MNKINKIACFLAVFCLSLVAFQAKAETPSIARQYHTFTSNSGFTDVAISGNYGYYVGSDLSAVGLEIFDLSNLANPQYVGAFSKYDLISTVSTSGPWVVTLDSIAVEGNYAYVGFHWAGGGFVAVINITDPANPTLTSTVAVSSLASNVNDIVISGNYAYVADSYNGLVIINISNPASLSVIGNYNSPGDAKGVAVMGNYAYVADGTSGVEAVSITDPTSPTLVGSYDTAGTAYKVKTNKTGSTIYVADGEDGLINLNVYVPSSITLRGSYDLGDARDVVVEQTYGTGVMVADVAGGITLLDTYYGDPIHYYATYNSTLAYSSLVLSGNYLYTSDTTYGVSVINVSSVYAPTLAAHLDASGKINSMAQSGDYLYTTENSSLKIYNVSDPSAVSLVSTTTGIGTLNSIVGITIDGDYAYLTVQGVGLEIFNISDPASPTNVAIIPIGDYIEKVTVADGRAYVADSTTGVLVYDVSTPATPTLITTYDTPKIAYEAAISGNYAYIADYDSMQVVDITSSSIVASIAMPGSNANAIAISGNYAFVSNYLSGLQIVDISNLSALSIVGSYDTSGATMDVTVDGDYVYLADLDGGLKILDITDITHPSLLTQDITALNKYANGVEVGSNGTIFLSSYGLSIYYADLDGDGLYNNVDTDESNPYADYSPSDSAQYAELIDSVTIVNGYLQVTYKSGLVKSYLLFPEDDGSNILTTQYLDTAYYLVLNSAGTEIAMVNIYNGSIVDYRILSVNNFTTTFLNVVTMRGKNWALVAEKNAKNKVKLRVVRISDEFTFTKKVTKSFKNKAVKVSKTKEKKNIISFKTKKNLLVKQYLFTKKLKLKAI